MVTNAAVQAIVQLALVEQERQVVKEELLLVSFSVASLRLLQL